MSTPKDPKKREPTDSWVAVRPTSEYAKVVLKEYGKLFELNPRLPHFKSIVIRDDVRSLRRDFAAISKDLESAWIKVVLADSRSSDKPEPRDRPDRPEECLVD